jgi:translation initiation factor 2 alpha subunit (eIF-2alpha)
MTSTQTLWNGYYKNRTPKVGSIVFVKVNLDYNIKSTDIGIYVNMIEYDNLEALISITELTKYKVNLQSIFKPEKVYACVVLNEYKNKFDLSYIKVKKESKELLSECYEYLQRIVNIMKEYDIKNIITSNTLDQCYHENKNIYKETYQNLLLNPELYISDTVLEEFKKHITIKKYELYYNFNLEVFENNSLFLLREILNFIDDEI